MTRARANAAFPARKSEAQGRSGESTGDAKQNAYVDIRRKIIRLSLQPGASLDEGQFVKAYGLSRTPIREILIRLAGEGLVTLERNRGAYVSELTLDRLGAIFEAGDYLERALMRLASLRRTKDDLAVVARHMNAYERAVSQADTDMMIQSNNDFHEAIAEAARNPYFLESYRRILVDHERIGQLWYVRNLELGDTCVNARIIEQHGELYRALVDRDATRGEQAAMAHADACKDGVRQLLSGDAGAISELNINPIEL